MGRSLSALLHQGMEQHFWKTLFPLELVTPSPFLALWAAPSSSCPPQANVNGKRVGPATPWVAGSQHTGSFDQVESSSRPQLWRVEGMHTRVLPEWRASPPVQGPSPLCLHGCQAEKHGERGLRPACELWLLADGWGGGSPQDLGEHRPSAQARADFWLILNEQDQSSSCPWVSGSRRRDLGSGCHPGQRSRPASGQPLAKPGIAWCDWFCRESCPDTRMALDSHSYFGPWVPSSWRWSQLPEPLTGTFYSRPLSGIRGGRASPGRASQLPSPKVRSVPPAEEHAWLLLRPAGRC